jgi:hypothetical protein
MLRDTKGQTGVHFADSVALGDYNDDTHTLTAGTCKLPPYMQALPEGAKPYYIPLRALMVGGAPNLLVAGKLLAQSFHANSNTRLHPSEWSTGVAAGGTASLMVQRGWDSTSDALAHVDEVRKYLNSSAVGQPLEWSSLPTPEPPVATTCGGLGRCFSVDARGVAAAHTAGLPVYNESVTAPKCGGECPPLAADEWLALSSMWSLDGATARVGATLHATTSTTLKQSTAGSQWLDRSTCPGPGRACGCTKWPRSRRGAPCVLTAANTFDGYWACSAPAPPPPPPLPEKCSR